MVLLKTSQNSLKNIGVGIFLIKSEVWKSATLLRMIPAQALSCEFCKSLKNSYFLKHQWVDFCVIQLWSKFMINTFKRIWFWSTLQHTQPVIILKIEIYCKYFSILLTTLVIFTKSILTTPSESKQITKCCNHSFPNYIINI